MFSGDGVNRLRDYLNSKDDLEDTEANMYDDHEAEDNDNDQQVAGLMHATALNDDDDDMDEGETGEGSQYELEGEG